MSARAYKLCTTWLPGCSAAAFSMTRASDLPQQQHMTVCCCRESLSALQGSLSWIDTGKATSIGSTTPDHPAATYPVTLLHPYLYSERSF
jgi:hypothetical protein